MLEQGPEHGGAEVPDGFVPVEPASGRRSLPCPEHPRGEDAVEEGLDEGGAEEGRAALALEADAEGILQCSAHGPERGGVTSRLYAGKAVAGIGGEEPCQVPGLDERRPVGEGAAEVFAEGRADVAGEVAGRLEPGLELALCRGEPEGLQPGWVARGVLAEQHEVAGVGDEHEAVLAPVAADLVAIGGQPRVVADGLDLDDAALGGLPLARPSTLELARGVESEVGVSRALLCQLADAVDLRLECRADGCEEVVEGRVVGALAGRTAGGAYAAKVAEVVLDRGGEFGCGHGHSVPQRGEGFAAEGAEEGRGSSF